MVVGEDRTSIGSMKDGRVKVGWLEMIGPVIEVLRMEGIRDDGRGMIRPVIEV